MYYFHPFWSTNHSLQSLLLSLLFYYLFHRFIIHSYFYWYWIHHDVFYYSSSYSLTDKAKYPDCGTPAGVEIAVAFDIETAGCPTKKQILSFVSAAVAGDATDDDDTGGGAAAGWAYKPQPPPQLKSLGRVNGRRETRGAGESQLSSQSMVGNPLEEAKDKIWATIRGSV